MYARGGRPSIPPEKLLRALLLQALYTIRSERLLMEQPDCASRASLFFKACGGFGGGGRLSLLEKIVRHHIQNANYVGCRETDGGKQN